MMTFRFSYAISKQIVSSNAVRAAAANANLLSWVDGVSHGIWQRGAFRREHSRYV